MGERIAEEMIRYSRYIILFSTVCILLFSGPGAFADKSVSGTDPISNPTLVLWKNTWDEYKKLFQSNGLPVDLDECDGSIPSTEGGNLKIGNNGEQVVETLVQSNNGNYQLNIGAGLTDNDLWFASVIYNVKSDPLVCQNNTTCMVCAFDDIYYLISDGTNTEVSQKTDEILTSLCEQDKTSTYMLKQKVFRREELGDGTYSIGVYSLSYLKAFIMQDFEKLITKLGW